ncbi:MAG: acyl-CoA/acyl-ACP dehydrogenase [Rubrivivax sp.]|nr:acyl-CoA/acyl-ACP dehydrogenase [Burkholderiales bacterium]MCW5637029.1 acyl-CoA/acyl-ACP dehydrogenase [Rubrivivax sp.]
MSETKAALVRTAERLFGAFCPPAVVNAAEQGTWPEALWKALADAGLLHAWLPEAAGGSGLAVRDILVLLRSLGAAAAPVPLAETLLAGWLLHRAGLRAPEGPLSIAPVAPDERIVLRRSGRGFQLAGAARLVPWAAASARIAVVGRSGSDEWVALVDGARCRIAPGHNLAGEPRDAVDFYGVAVDAADVAAVPAGTAGDAWARGALLRAAQMTGALEKALALSLRYAGDRVQFGKPIGRFQAIQHQLAQMAAEVAAACVAVDAAGQALDRGAGLAEIGCAKLRVGEAAGVVAAFAHQIHGAIGVTFEHVLHHSTRRLWSWRDEFGSETAWAGYLGHWVLQSPEAYWSALTSPHGLPAGATPLRDRAPGDPSEH